MTARTKLDGVTGLRAREALVSAESTHRCPPAPFQGRGGGSPGHVIRSCHGNSHSIVRTARPSLASRRASQTYAQPLFISVETAGGGAAGRVRLPILPWSTASGIIADATPGPRRTVSWDRKDGDTGPRQQTNFNFVLPSHTPPWRDGLFFLFCFVLFCLIVIKLKKKLKIFLYFFVVFFFLLPLWGQCSCVLTPVQGQCTCVPSLLQG